MANETKWTKWTKGPLRVSGKHPVIIEEERERFPGYRPMVAEVFQRSAEGETLATAHLFAASPTLYEALAGLVAKLDSLGTLRLPSVEAARAALSKARGEGR